MSQPRNRSNRSRPRTGAEASPECIKQSTMPELSVITAFLNEADNLPEFRRRVTTAVDRLGVDAEIVLVDDHSSDASAALARDWATSDRRVVYVRLSRNCGSHSAFSAGLAHCQGRCAVFLAADLQDP